MCALLTWEAGQPESLSSSVLRPSDCCWGSRGTGYRQTLCAFTSPI